MLKVSQLSKKIQGKQILNDVSFEVSSHQIAIFLGGSGVGKSTLLRVLNGLETYDSGFFQLEDPSHTVGMVFQDFNLFEHLNAEENITLALRKSKKINSKEASLIAGNLLNRYGLHDKAKASVRTLSGGQKQRLAIARTVALDPKVICMDEPTSALDPHLTHQVAQYITELAEEGRTILLTTHDLELLNHLNGNLFLMEAGAITESASNKEWLSNEQAFPKLHQYLNGRG